MQKHTVDEVVDRFSKSNAMMGLALIGMSIIALAMSHRFLYNAYAGPFPADEKLLTEMKRPGSAPKYYVMIKPDNILTTDIGWVRKSRYSTQEKPESALLMLAVGQHFVPTRIDIDDIKNLKSGFVIGELVPLEKKVDELLKSEIKEPAVLNAILPLELKASDTFKAMAWAETILFTIVAACGAFRIFKVKVVWSDLEKHPVGKALSRHGRVEAVKSEMNSDFTTDGVSLEKSGSLIGKQWALLMGEKPFAFKLDEVVWVYESSANAPSRHEPKQRGVVVCLQSGEKHYRSLPEADCAELVKRVSDRAPWAYSGFDDTLARNWHGNARQIVDSVQERKKARGR